MATIYRFRTARSEVGPDGKKRRDPRQAVYMVAAVVIAPELAAPVHCTLRDRSVSGARLEKDPIGLRRTTLSGELPALLTVHVARERIEFDCRVVWRDGRHFGVQFLGEARPMDPEPPAAA